MKVLNCTPEKPVSAKTRRSVTSECRECGSEFEAGPRRPKFCSRKCIRDWNNRRATRGAELYDLLMISRLERDVAKEHKVWRTINRMVRHFADQDEAERDGRRSYHPMKKIKETRPFLWAE